METFFLINQSKHVEGLIKFIHNAIPDGHEEANWEKGSNFTQKFILKILLKKIETIIYAKHMNAKQLN